MPQSIASLEFLLLLLANLLALAIASRLARLPATNFRGVVLGVSSGAVSAVVLTAAAVFLSYILPLAQIEFWIASILYRQ